MAEGLTMEYLERRFDGAIPRRLKDIVIYGSALKADIAELEDLIEHYADQVARHNRSARTWRERTALTEHQRVHNRDMAVRNECDGRAASATLAVLHSKLDVMKGRLNK